MKYREALTTWLKILQKAGQQDEFIKLKLSQPRTKDDVVIENIYIKKILLKDQVMYSATYRYKTKDITKNYTKDTLLLAIENWIEQDFKTATLITTEGVFTLRYNRKNRLKLLSTKQKNKAPQPEQHNRKKQYLIEENAPFLQYLGISSSNGKVLAAQYDKFRQINKYIEIIDSLLKNTEQLPQHIVDMGCGKGYLTFALYAYLKERTDQDFQIVGVELREHLVKFCNEKAQDLGWKGLSFVARNIEDYPIEKTDMLIALHACDTATDLAIAQGVGAKAQWILTAPCCHRQIRRAMKKGEQEVLGDVLRFGILEERQAEIITDGIRALLMEKKGYSTKVFEFISNEHTAKNLMIIGTKEDKEVDTQAIQTKVDTIKQQFGIDRHYLEEILPEQG